MSLELFSTMRVVALPTKTNFRGINLREVALFKGEFGWGEFSPFLEYGYEESAPWLQCAIEAATKPRPKLYRNSVKVNGTIPALNDSAEIEKIVAAALKDGGTLKLADDKGRIVMVPIEKLAYVELGIPNERKVGFAAS